MGRQENKGEKGGKEVRRADKKNLTLKRPVLWKSDRGIKKYVYEDKKIYKYKSEI